MDSIPANLLKARRLRSRSIIGNKKPRLRSRSIIGNKKPRLRSRSIIGNKKPHQPPPGELSAKAGEHLHMLSSGFPAKRKGDPKRSSPAWRTATDGQGVYVMRVRKT